MFLWKKPTKEEIEQKVITMMKYLVRRHLEIGKWYVDYDGGMLKWRPCGFTWPYEEEFMRYFHDGIKPNAYLHPEDLEERLRDQIQYYCRDNSKLLEPLNRTRSIFGCSDEDRGAFLEALQAWHNATGRALAAAKWEFAARNLKATKPLGKGTKPQGLEGS